MNFLSSIASLVTGGTNVQAEVAQVESELTTAAYAIAVFMVVVVLELFAIILLLKKR